MAVSFTPSMFRSLRSARAAMAGFAFVFAGWLAPSVAQATEPLSVERQFLAERISFGANVLIDRKSGQVLVDPIPYQNNRRLEGDEFYRVIGRGDLVQAYRSRMTTRIALILGGVAGVLAGVALTYWSLAAPCRLYDVAARQCLTETGPPLWLGGSLAGAGLLAGLVGLFLGPHPVDGRGMVGLAEEYNLKLRERLEKESQTTPPEPVQAVPQALLQRLRLDVALTPGFVAVTAALAF